MADSIQNMLVFIASGISFLTAILLAYLKRNSNSIRGPVYWSFGSLLIGIGLLLFALYPHSGEFGAFVLAGSIATTGLCLNLAGLQKFYGSKLNHLIIFGLPLFQFLQGTLFLRIVPLPDIRMALYSIVNILFSLFIIIEFLKPVPAIYRKISYFGAFVFFVFGLTMTARLIHSIFFTPENAAKTTIISLILFYSTILSQILISFVFIHMFNRRLANELEEQLTNRDKFFSIIAHDLNGPIGTISEVIKALNHMKQMGEENQHKLMLELEKLSDSTWFLLQNLLYWSRIKLDTVHPVKLKFDLKLTIEQNIELFSEIAHSKSIKIKFNSEPQLICYSDPQISDIILRNLISNALKFTPRNGEIAIYSSNLNEIMHVEIRDNGNGIQAQDLETLLSFKSFISNYGTDGEKGSGLGLILCHELLEKTGGSLTIQSTENVGTSVKIEFPSNLQIEDVKTIKS